MHRHAAPHCHLSKCSYDTLVHHVGQGHCYTLPIRAHAEIRLAEEYDAAQGRGEAPKRGGDRRSDQRGEAPPLVRPEDVGGKGLLREARRLRDAEAADPGIVDRTVNEIVERGEEPRPLIPA